VNNMIWVSGVYRMGGANLNFSDRLERDGSRLYYQAKPVNGLLYASFIFFPFFMLLASLGVWDNDIPELRETLLDI